MQRVLFVLLSLILLFNGQITTPTPSRNNQIQTFLGNLQNKEATDTVNTQINQPSDQPAVPSQIPVPTAPPVEPQTEVPPAPSALPVAPPPVPPVQPMIPKPLVVKTTQSMPPSLTAITQNKQPQGPASPPSSNSSPEYNDPSNNNQNKSPVDDPDPYAEYGLLIVFSLFCIYKVIHSERPETFLFNEPKESPLKTPLTTEQLMQEKRQEDDDFDFKEFLAMDDLEEGKRPKAKFKEKKSSNLFIITVKK